MKKLYQKIEIEIILFSQDIITESDDFIHVPDFPEEI